MHYHILKNKILLYETYLSEMCANSFLCDKRQLMDILERSWVKALLARGSFIHRGD